jgi:hypothetical protein
LASRDASLNAIAGTGFASGFRGVFRFGQAMWDHALALKRDRAGGSATDLVDAPGVETLPGALCLRRYDAMVPGMTERDRRIADMVRLTWLADATVGPTRIGFAATKSAASPKPRWALPTALWRHGLASARILGQRIRLNQPSAPDSGNRHRPAPAR